MSTSASTSRPNYPLLMLAYLLLFVGCAAVLYWEGSVRVLPVEARLLRFDANFYLGIRDNGYGYNPGNPSTAGFFPLFPYVWRWSGLGIAGICIANGLLYLVSLGFLCRLLRPKPIVLGLFMSLPFLFFVWTPLTEALYFALTTLLLYGLVRKNGWLIFTSLLLAGLTRASFIFLVPALVGMVWMTRPKAEVFSWPSIRRILLWCLLPLGLSVAIVAVIQYVQVGDPFAYYKLQTEVWGRKFALPVLPMGVNKPRWIIRTTRMSLWIGGLVSVIGLRYLVQWLWRDRLRPTLRPIELVAIIYLCMCVVSIVFFNPTWFWWSPGERNATYLVGINRYLQPNPFMLVFLVYLFRQRLRSPWALLGLAVATHLLWFTVALDYLWNQPEYEELLVVTAALLAYWLYYYFRWPWLGYALIVFGAVVQAVTFDHFLWGLHLD
ncbi:hypothetical protein [Neolewinella sp.]|uniref:hypothetical protein n=1 Tax=Neolewinella sp. TaxID=2993543 RepID=UPI003B52202F